MREDAENDEPDGAHHQQRHTPAERRAQSEAHDRRERVTEIPADTVRRIRVAEPARRDVRIEDREIGRVEDAVARAHDRSARKEPPGVRRERRGERAAGEQAETCQQHGACAEPVDDEARRELHEAARDVKYAGDEPEQRPRDVELRAQQRKQRWQRELQEMRNAVREADDANDAGIPAERRGGCGIQCGSTVRMRREAPTIAHAVPCPTPGESFTDTVQS